MLSPSANEFKSKIPDCHICNNSATYEYTECKYNLCDIFIHRIKLRYYNRYIQH